MRLQIVHHQNVAAIQLRNENFLNVFQKPNLVHRAFKYTGCTQTAQPQATRKLIAAAVADPSLDIQINSAKNSVTNMVAYNNRLSANLGKLQVDTREEATITGPNAHYPSGAARALDVGWASNMATTRNAYVSGLGDACVNGVISSIFILREPIHQSIFWHRYCRFPKLLPNSSPIPTFSQQVKHLGQPHLGLLKRILSRKSFFFRKIPYSTQTIVFQGTHFPDEPFKLCSSLALLDELFYLCETGCGLSLRGISFL